MSIFNDEHQTDAEFTIPFEHPDLPDSKWFFAKEPSLEDAQELRKMEVALKAYEDDEARALESIRNYLGHMSRGWEGEAYTLSTKFRGRDGKKHKLAGELPPATLEFIQKVPGRYCMAAYLFIVRHYAGLRRTEDEEESFPGPDPRVDGSEAESGSVSPTEQS